MTDRKSNLIMLVGLPGTGKTSFIEQHQLAITNVYGVETLISSDAIIDDAANFLAKTYSEVFTDVIDLANRYVEVMVGLMSTCRRDFIIDRTNLTRKSRQRMLDLTKNRDDYNKIAIVFPAPNAIELRSRLDTRANLDGKIIPPTLLAEMQARYEAPVVTEGFDKILTPEEFLETLPKLDAQVYGEARFG